jgi:hypothetical protein
MKRAKLIQDHDRQKLSVSLKKFMEKARKLEKESKVTKVKKTPTEERESKVATLVMQSAIVTEVARYIAVVEPDPLVREKLYWKLMVSLDYSAGWVKHYSTSSLDVLYHVLQTDEWEVDRWSESKDNKRSGGSKGEPSPDDNEDI